MNGTSECKTPGGEEEEMETLHCMVDKWIMGFPEEGVSAGQ
jgi:hypothetical protein